MTERRVDTAGVLWGDRHTPVGVIAGLAQQMEASGVVDGLLMSDQLANFIPPSLWTPENTPLAMFLSDPDSLDDPFVMSTYARATAPKLDISIATDAVRHGPAQLIRTMLTLANITEGRATLHVGAGEVKQCNPFGWKRSQGLTRFEDLLRIFQEFWNSDQPIDFQGHHWTLKHAYLGGAKPYRPRIWAMGVGPKLLDLATTFCDGVTGAAPLTWATPLECGERIDRLKADLRRKGRDPDEFGFGIVSPVLLHEDQSAIDRALDNPLVRWLAAVMGRIDPADWRKDGLESPVPDGWTYHMKLLPHATRPGFVDDVLNKSTRQHAEKSFFFGTPSEVAVILKGYLDAGVTWVAPVDYMTMVSDFEDALGALGRNIALCRGLKAV